MGEARLKESEERREEEDIDVAFMREALKEAEKAVEERAREVPVGAVAVRDGKIIARAHNLKETLDDPTAHAELLVLREAAKVVGDWRLTEVTIYTTLEPCAMCAGAMIQARVKRLVYGASDPRMGAVESKVRLLEPGLFNHDVEVRGGVLAEECAKLVKSFFRRIREEERKGS